ncbi:MAG: S46 family peptidase [Cyclobacteriaceae bacterium]
MESPFEFYGTSIPPDATFSIRTAEGGVWGYNYNGTRAPCKTTFYGLYARYYSLAQNYPWDLPAKWQNPLQSSCPKQTERFPCRPVV